MTIYCRGEVWSTPHPSIGVITIHTETRTESEHQTELSLAAAEELIEQLSRHVDMCRMRAKPHGDQMLSKASGQCDSCNEVRLLTGPFCDAANDTLYLCGSCLLEVQHG